MSSPGAEASRIEAIDTRHLGFERAICCWRVGEVIIDPGPTPSLPAVIEALGDSPPRAVLATHIHLDHAGGIGALVRRWPELTVYVHDLGAEHLADPDRLLASASKLYGDRMAELWGEVVPVPEERIVTLSGGETVEGLEVAYTPGHASHHVSYLDGDSGTAFVGDTCGVRIPPSDYILAPTPPPDIDVEAWRGSLELIERWQPSAVAVTHFGRYEPAAEHIESFRESLARSVERAGSLDAGAFTSLVADEVEQATDPETAAAYEHAAPFDHLHSGLERYLRKKAEAG